MCSWGRATIPHVLETLLPLPPLAQGMEPFHYAVVAASIAIALAGLAGAWWFFGGTADRAERVRAAFPGIHRVLSGKYYVKSVKHVFGAGGYTMELACIKDATGRMEQGRASAAKPNLAAAKDPNELRPIELVDPETGRTELAYRRE